MKLFGLSNSQGLSNVLQTNTPLDHNVSIKQLLCETGIPGLYILPAGGSIAEQRKRPSFSPHVRIVGASAGRVRHGHR